MPEPRPSAIPWRRNLLFASIGVVIAGVAFSLITPFLPLYLEELGVRRNLAIWSGWVFAVNALTYSLMAPVWGTLADRHGKRVMLLRSGFGIALTYVLMAVSANQWQFLFFRAANGVLSGFIPSSLMLVATNTPGPDLGFALGTIQTASSVGGIMGPMVGGAAAKLLGLRPALFFGAGLLCVAAVTAFLGTREEIERREGGPGVLAGLRASFSQPELVALFAVMLLVQTALMAVQPTLPLFIADLARHDVALVTGILFSLAGVSTALGAPLIGRIRRIDHLQAMRLGLLAAAALSGLQGLAGRVWLLGLERFLFGFANAAVLVSGNVLIAQGSPEHLRGQVFGTLNAVSSLGTILGPILGGYAAKGLGVPSSFYLSGLLFLAGLFILRRGRVGKEAVDARTWKTDKAPEQSLSV